MLALNFAILGGLFVLIFEKDVKKVYHKALLVSFIVFFLSLILLFAIQPAVANFIVETRTITDFPLLSINFAKAIDGFSVLFIVLSTFLIVLCILSGATIKYRKKLFFSLLLLTELALVNVFAVTEILYFYIWFEAILIPVFLIIGIWGSRQEKIAAAYQFFIYTLLGSLSMLLSILFISTMVGSTNIWIVRAYEFSPIAERLIWLTFFFSFAVKIPMFPFHLWLPKAHVEAPTAGSVLLAGILLKLGSYGFLRFSIFLFPSATEFFQPMIIVLALLGVIYSSFTILRQIDLKRIIAYSSVSHMNYVILGCFGGNLISLYGATLLMLAHGIVSAGLFLGVGYLYDRYKSRNILYYRGLVTVMPLYTLCFFILILANLGFPPTLNFISEFLVLSGLMEKNIFISLLSGFSIFFAGVSGFWIFTRIFFGNFAVTNGFYHIRFYYDLTLREMTSILPLVVLAIFFGIYPNIFLNYIIFTFSVWGI